MIRRIQRLTLAPVPEPVARVFRRRGLDVPEMETERPPAATWPYLPRWRHRAYANRHGYFWLPCLLCLRPFGGHEVVDRIPDPMKGGPFFISICPACTAQRNGGRP